jgi:hypothetical protein
MAAAVFKSVDGALAGDCVTLGEFGASKYHAAAWLRP